MTTKRPFGMSVLALVLVITVTFGSLSADESEPNKVTGNANGTWKMASRIEDGAKTPEEDLAGIRLILKNDTWKFSRNGEIVAEGTFKYAATENGVKTVDLTTETGDNAGQKSQHISKLEGDKLTICQAPAGQECPTKFESKAGSGHILTVWVREKK